MKGTFQTFIKTEDEISYVHVTYLYDFHGKHEALNPCIYSIRVSKSDSGDITEYIGEDWMEAFNKLATIDIKENLDLIDKYNKLGDEHNIASFHVAKMIEAGYSKDRIIEQVTLLANNAYQQFRKAISLSPPAPIIISKEQYEKFNKNDTP